MNSSQFQTLARSILKIVGSALAAHGATKAAGWLNGEDVTGTLLTIAGLAWSHFASSTPAIQQKAADSLPVGTVLPATTDEQPKAQVVTPIAPIQDNVI